MKNNVDEAISFTTSKTSKGERFYKWVKLASAKYDLGKLTDYAITSDWKVTGLTLGPIKNQSAPGKYLHLIASTIGGVKIGVKSAETGAITHFLLSDKKGAAKPISGGGYSLVENGEKFIEITKDVVKFDQLFLLAINSGGISSAEFAEEFQVSDSKVVFDINKRFELLVKLTRMVANRKSAGMIVTGSGGLGKTYTIMDTFEKLGLVVDEDFAYLKGAKLTPVTFYTYLYDNADRIIVFDDSDTILDNPDVQNMLKSALDTSGLRTVTYMSVAISNIGYPTTFVFPGQIIFIANRSQNQINQALLSRSLYVDVSMTRPEALERMGWIVDHGTPKDVACSAESMKIAFKLLQDFVLRGPGKKAELPRDLNMRTLIKAAVIVEANPGDYDDLIFYVFSQ